MSVLICNLAKGTNPDVPCYSQMPSSSSSCLPTDVRSRKMYIFRSFDISHSSSNPVHEDNVMSLLDLTIADNLGRTALHWAAVTDQPELVSRLIEAGAYYEVLTIYDETPLALAAREGAFASCGILLSVGAKQDFVDYLNRTPKNLAQLGGHTEVVRLLEAVATLSSMPAMSRDNADTNRLAVDLDDLYSTRMIAGEFATPRFQNLPKCCDSRGCGNTVCGKRLSCYSVSSNSTNQIFTLRPESAAQLEGQTVAGIPPGCNWPSIFEGNDMKYPRYRRTLVEREGPVPNATITTATTTITTTTKSGPGLTQLVKPEIYVENSFQTIVSASKLNVTPNTSYFVFPLLYHPELTQNPFPPTCIDPSDCDTDQLLVPPKPDKVGVVGGDNHIMSSDSESLNHWSFSPSDTSPKHTRVVLSATAATHYPSTCQMITRDSLSSTHSCYGGVGATPRQFTN